MELAYSDEQTFLREAVRGAVDREAPLPRVREWVLEDGKSDAAGLADRQGWTGIGIDEDAGGQGGGVMELAILAEELGRGAVPADALYATVLASRVAGEPLESACLLASAAAPLAAGTTLVLGAPDAARFVALDGTVHDGLDVTPRALIDPTRSLGDVAYDGEGAETPDGLAETAAIMVAADALGASQRMLDLTLEYVKDRVQFGVAVGSFQAVKHAASEMLVAIEGARSAIQYAAWAADNPDAVEGPAVDAWVAKAHASRAARLVADKALFLHGAVGYTWEHDLQLLIKRAKSDAQLFGGPAAYDDLVADGLQLTSAAGT